ncbi:MerR family transcriptional regulator [Streptomyces sp. NPDC052496]|uniref:MerR family transcriptional regulator n=1 Tax=Streptomyces sp. NPDC052496 TaxID=3154951 RepID=UPI003444D34D
MLIGELSRRTGVSPRLLRYYEEQGLLSAERGPNGYRCYDDSTVVTVLQVRALLDAGLTTEVIRAVLPCARGVQPEIEMCPSVRAVLNQVLADTEERIDHLQRSRNAVAGYLGQQS